MSSKLCDIIADVMHVPVSQINDNSGPESIKTWDSFSIYLLLNEIEEEFKVTFTLDEIVRIKNVADIKKHLHAYGIVLNG